MRDSGFYLWGFLFITLPLIGIGVTLSSILSHLKKIVRLMEAQDKLRVDGKH